ncbi:tyrosinase family protein [Nitrosomonas ureae]|uniref:Common central domain of tyrosinase n=1 Tax=Nitrosomonas ureae TaxID=44577 RepID=A0A1H5XBP9_9PROT|nr:tyrosinase family protein [Nitrosomonas ureae]SEG08636.1 Common central domain of tyrosinase [Nitrosomonas ureae]
MGIRKNQNKLTNAEKTRFVNAVKKMKADTAAAYNYDKYVTIHNTAFSGNMDLNPAHMGPAFFPWHRYFLRKFERDLEAADRALGKDGNVTLPYWDWTHDNANEANRQRGSIWKDNFMGGYGDPVTTGPFRTGEWTTIPPGPAMLVRALGRTAIDANAVNSLPTEAEVNDALTIKGFDCVPWSTDSLRGPSLPTPPAPILTGTGGGTLATGVYRVVITYVNVLGETRPSQESTICLGGGCTPSNTNNAIRITSPPAQASASGYNVYVTAANGASLTETKHGGTTLIGTSVSITNIVPGDAFPTMNSTGSYRNFLEGWISTRGQPELHNRIHMWVAGSMSPGTSPNDPVFFLHHCNIDRLWALWQYRNPGQNYPLVVPRTSPPPGNRPHGLNDLMPPWIAPPEEVRPVNVLNHRPMGYSYDTDPVGLSINVAP